MWAHYFIPSTCYHWVLLLVSGTTEQLLCDCWHATYEFHVLFGGYSLNDSSFSTWHEVLVKGTKAWPIKPVSVSPQICSRGSPQMFSRHEETGLNRSEWLHWSNVTVCPWVTLRLGELLPWCQPGCWHHGSNWPYWQVRERGMLEGGGQKEVF